MKKFFKIFFIFLIFTAFHFSPSFGVSSEPNMPVLLPDMTPINWDKGYENEVSYDDLDWYNYSGSVKQWANAKDSSGNYWTWIPRFTYKIENDKALIKWSVGTEDDTANGFKLHPAFVSEEYLGNGDYKNKAVDHELTGFWVAKYLMSESNGAFLSKKNTQPYVGKNIGEAFEVCLDMKEGYGVSSHLIKASEWGAISLLTSALGKEPSMNTENITGSQGMFSTTGNYYGVYDMNGPINEYLSAYVMKDVINSYALKNAGLLIKDEYRRFVDVVSLEGVDNPTNNLERLKDYYGFAMTETSSFDLYDIEEVPTDSSPFFARGGNGVGLYGYTKSNGSGLGFRPTISVYTSYLFQDSSFFDTEASIVAEDYLVLSVNFSVDEDWRFPLYDGEVIIENGSVVSGQEKRLFDFIDLRYVQENEVMQFSNGYLNEHLIGIIENDETVMRLDSDTVFKGNTQYTLRVRVGGVKENGEPVFLPIPDMTSKIIVESIGLRNKADDSDIKIVKIPNNKVRLTVYDPNGRVPILTGVRLYKAPEKVDYYQGEPLALTGGQLEVSYGDNKAIIKLGREHVKDYDSATDTIGNGQLIELVYGEMKVLQKGDDGAEEGTDEFRINVGSRKYNVTVVSDPKNTATITGGPGLYEEGETVNLNARLHPGYKFSKWEKDGTTISNDISASFTMPAKDVVVTAKTVGPTRLEVVDPQLEFEQNDPFGLGKGKIIAYYGDGTSEELTLISPGVESSPTNGQILDTLGEHPVEISYAGVKTGYYINSSSGISEKYNINVVKKKYNLMIAIDSADYGSVEMDGSTIVPGQDNAIIVSLKVSYHDIVNLKAIAKEGYVFDGWYDINNSCVIEDNKFESEEIRLLMPEDNVTLKANFVKAYKVTYKVNDENMGAILDINKNESNSTVTYVVKSGGYAPKIQAVSKTGHDFVIWSDGRIHADRNDGPIYSDVTYTANFVKVWTVQYLVDGVEFETKTVRNGDNGYISKVPTKYGEVFADWDRDLSCITSDIITNARFVPVISINPNGNETPSDFVTATILGNGIVPGTLEYIISESPTDTGEKVSGYHSNDTFIFNGSWTTDPGNSELYRSYLNLSSKEDSSTTITINCPNDKEIIRFDYMFSAVDSHMLGITVNGNRVTEPDIEYGVWHRYNAEVRPINGKVIIGISYSQDESYDENDYAAIRNLKIGRYWIPIDNEYALNDMAVWKNNYVHIRGQVREDIRYSHVDNRDMYPNGMHQVVSNVFKGKSENVGEIFTITYNLYDGIVSPENPTSYTAETEDIKLNNPIKDNAKFIGWTGSNGTTPNMNVTIEKGSTGNKEYYANYKQDSYTITSSYSGSGNIDPAKATVDYGQNATFNISPNADYIIKALWVDGDSEPVTNKTSMKYEFTNVTSDHTISAEFVPAKYTITASADAGGTITPETTTVDYGESIEFTITPNSSYIITSVVVDGESKTVTNENGMTYMFSNVDKNHTIHAKFKEVKTGYTVSVTTNPLNMGTISGTGTYTPGDTVTLTATPPSRYTFKQWKVLGNSISLKNKEKATITFTMPENDVELVAEFTNTYHIDVTQTNNGTITPYSKTVGYGQSETFHITPSKGARIQELFIDGAKTYVSTSDQSGMSYTFRNVTADHEIWAIFYVPKSY